MKIQVKQISEVMPYFNNPRNNRAAIEPVAESIKRYGFVKPIIVDTNNVIIAGHTRYFAAQLLGLDTLPVVVSDMDEHKAQMYRIIDNKVAEKAFFDDGKLLAELKSMNLDAIQPFFFEDLLEMVDTAAVFNPQPQPASGASYDDADYSDGGYDGYDSPANDYAAPSSAPQQEATADINPADDLDDLFEPKIVNGERVMKVYCPYCKHIEIIKL